ncbi:MULTISPECIES: OB-fold nucleic acid binding domain-containing protein [unclassified Amycolatopsis]|uniref:OB-fold nucleic acid binding domain-containing protein n=1 Tax=unclassified Amycolatopsis TaxID=2618356 RepID=UPI001FF3CBD6|nr:MULTISPECIES: OB-fold nucleic acid binding domain-containing protein [unclassified Amycolatopsis]UOZ02394.1 OB-fold nucleic acid binding domain-containing protein [Amycolatopsis sp. WQ 127309]WSJ77871.1 OB-fold nucleic acid binding domain-containing protein [Amycolatopsis sp. NBC_01307]WSK78555.1 OB-fold nucleic acid binding domain-containing protein [Amycolatopsis sp. NBC_01286]
MSAKDGGYFSRLVRKLTSDVEDLDADEMSMRSDAEGAQRACDCRSGEEVTVLGRLRSVELCPTNEAATLEAELFDGTQGVTLIWLGRRRIAGIEPGRTIKVRGRMATRDGQKVLYNPYYELQSPVS